MNRFRNQNLILAIVFANIFLSFVTFAGEFKIIDEKLYYNTGTKDELEEGWNWIISTDSVPYKYFVHEGFALADIPTLDGNKLDQYGRLIENGILATISEITDDMYRETNWDNFVGSYHITQLEDTSHEIQNFGQFEWPVKVSEVEEGISITWNGLYKGNEIFVKSNTVFSLESKNSMYIDVIDENNFRLIFDTGEEATVVKN